ncbi:FAD-dependent oxidoreductase [Halomonas qinghailakensis]|uniref:FAD-dependent oxidoreductase n=1 Tax=Halomonas qinghailakensis TaxID=2937790 RepID=A0AA46TV86_9GAMM|nr:MULTISPECIES: FAD-dependent oxidoreductase [Halomonas]UYO76172.1 FAD-dependent oxidoreductase [Halomonas sp. ZZQ-149]
MTTTHPAVVIGGGIVGICCALYLQREGLEVTLVEPARVNHRCYNGTLGSRPTAWA